MPTILLDLQAGTLPVGACYTDEQTRLVAYADHLKAVLNGQTFFNYGSTAPDPEFRSYPWLRTTDMRWYEYVGVWRSPVNYSPFDRRLFSGTLTDLQTYDGGDTNAPSPTSGPMWVEDTDAIGRSPMHPGAIPTSNPAKTLNVGEAYGEGAHALIATELPAVLPLTANLPGHRTNLEAGAPQWLCPTGSGGTVGTTPSTEDATITFNNTNGDVAHQTTHPVIGRYTIKWSGRLYYVAT